MMRKKNAFLTFCFSLLPGAGHMYMGFMKFGLSSMALFFAIIFLSSWLAIGPLLYLLPILWFYTFFDCINKLGAPDEEFAKFEDQPIFPSLWRGHWPLSGRGAVVAGLLLLFFGVCLLWDNCMRLLIGILPAGVYSCIRTLSNSLPQTVVGVLIIALGVWLIVGKRKEMKRDV